MDKYFETLDLAAFRMQHMIDSPKAKRLFKHVLDTEHDAGPEADYIIRMWREARGIKSAESPPPLA